jgi:hypothetical protein
MLASGNTCTPPYRDVEREAPRVLQEWPFHPNHFARMDDSPDTEFYESARLVTHIDDEGVP